MLKYFWFLAAAVMVVNVIVWHYRLSSRVEQGLLTSEDSRRFTRGAAAWLVIPCIVLGLISLGAGWSSPWCAGRLSFRDMPSSAYSLVVLVLWGALLGWIWVGSGASLLSRVHAVLSRRNVDRAVSPRTIRWFLTAAILVSTSAQWLGPQPSAEARARSGCE